MAFIPSAVLDRTSGQLWIRYNLEPGFDAEALLDAMGLGLLWEEIEDAGHARILGALRPRDHLVILNDRHIADLEGNVGLRRFTIGHEIGHWLLHADAARSGTIPIDSDGRTWCRSGATEQLERQAEMFAARLLMPRDRLAHEVPTGRWSGWGPVYGLAETFVASPTAMIVRLEELKLAHRDPAGTPRSGQLPQPGQGQLFTE